TTTEVKIKNMPIRGKIQIVKKSADYNDITKDKKGALLEDAVFEVFDSKNVVVDRITTDSRGVATSKELPIDVYGIREITAPKHYILDDKVFYAEIKVHGDLVKFEVLNDSEELGVDVQKYGNYEAMPGDMIRYDFEKISNTSTVPLDDFYWRDILPTNAVRLNKIVTGTWSEHLTYEVLYKTNRRGWETLEDGLSSENSHTLDCSRSALRLRGGEYITEFKFEFGTVQAGFKQEDAPYILCSVNGNLPNEYRFTNKTDVGGNREDEFICAKDAWVTIIYAKPRGKLPQTGW
ncbi:MAG: prealbumin-like fold domain-containing protein, partial [Angelakisella sp.]